MTERLDVKIGWDEEISVWEEVEEEPLLLPFQAFHELLIFLIVFSLLNLHLQICVQSFKKDVPTETKPTAALEELDFSSRTNLRLCCKREAEHEAWKNVSRSFPPFFLGPNYADIAHLFLPLTWCI